MRKSVKAALEKARDSALLAVEIYNKPAVKFKSGGFITLMVIAWTSLFHSVFFKRGKKPFYRGKQRRFLKIDGDFKYWELDECLRNYFATDTGNAVRKNLEFFIPLRNQIEHRSMPALDASIFGECQALLLNFDDMLEKEFGLEHRIRESLSFSLQLFPSSDNLVDVVKHDPDTKQVADFIQRYRSTISPEIIASGKYSFKAFLIQVANHKNDNALPIRFVHYDKLSDEEKKQLGHLVAMVKFKEVPVSHLNEIRAGEVVKLVQQGLGNPKVMRAGKQVDRFNLDTHARCWRKHKIRPPSESPKPEETNWKFCIYDKRHDDYGYTQAWVDFLIEQLKKPEEFDSLFPTKTTLPDDVKVVGGVGMTTK